jgi:hypothetical protein
MYCPYADKALLGEAYLAKTFRQGKVEGANE